MSKESVRIKELEERLAIFEKSPYLAGYLSTLTQLDEWNNEMLGNPISLKSTGDEDMKAFDKAIKFLERKEDLYKQLDYFRDKMTEVDKEEADKKTVDSHSVEKYLMNKNGG